MNQKLFMYNKLMMFEMVKQCYEARNLLHASYCCTSYSKVAHLYAQLAPSETVVLKRAKFAAYIHLGELTLYTFPRLKKKPDRSIMWTGTLTFSFPIQMTNHWLAQLSYPGDEHLTLPMNQISGHVSPSRPCVAVSIPEYYM
jgi:hypothetical protein